jgi:hypothetical protein
MNTPTHDPRDAAGTDNNDDFPDALRWQLRALRTDEAPSRDLWSGIAAQLQGTRVRQSARRRWMVPTALAATLVIALGATGLWRGAILSPPTPDATSATLVQREADGMTRQYAAALTEVAAAPAAPGLQPTFDELDRNTRLILDALAHDPDSRLLLEQLRRTYAHRLALAQRAAYS